MTARSTAPAARLEGRDLSPLEGYLGAWTEPVRAEAFAVASDGEALRTGEVAAEPQTLFALLERESTREAPAFVRASVDWIVGPGWPVVRGLLTEAESNVKVVGVHRGLCDAGAFGDLGVVRSLPAVSAVVPADAPQARAAVEALAKHWGPAYLRLTSEPRPAVSDGTFAFARAAELAPGADLAVVAAGAALDIGLQVSRELQRVGLGARVLDLASAKPFDQKAIVRAAREAGALLAIEEHCTATGLGAMVAGAVAESVPVPVRGVGALDVRLAPGESPGEARAAYGITRDRALEEAWALLRGRAKVT